MQVNLHSNQGNQFSSYSANSVTINQIEYHNNLLFTKSLNTYIGAGPVYGKFYNADSSYWGANVVFGLEYKVLLLPFVVSADLKPTVKPGQDDWFDIGMGITFRYVFIKEKRKLFERNK